MFTKHMQHISMAKSKGVSLIEVMISVLILAIGLLGIAAMQATALRNNQSSVERTQATIHAYSILDSMRTNVVQARAKAYDQALTCTVPTGGSLAKNDLRQWMQSLQSQLRTDACGSVACVASVCTIKIQWNDSRGIGGIETQTFTTVSRI
jgi:type IV pilus assembly protein PilV